MIVDKKNGIANQDDQRNDPMRKERIIVYAGIGILIALVVAAIVVTMIYIGDYARTIG